MIQSSAMDCTSTIVSRMSSSTRAGLSEAVVARGKNIAAYDADQERTYELLGRVLIVIDRSGHRRSIDQDVSNVVRLKDGTILIASATYHASTNAFEHRIRWGIQDDIISAASGDASDLVVLTREKQFIAFRDGRIRSSMSLPVGSHFGDVAVLNGRPWLLDGVTGTLRTGETILHSTDFMAQREMVTTQDGRLVLFGNGRYITILSMGNGGSCSTTHISNVTDVLPESNRTLLLKSRDGTVQELVGSTHLVSLNGKCQSTQILFATPQAFWVVTTPHRDSVVRLSLPSDVDR